MNELIRKLRHDQEIRKLKEKCHELTEKWSRIIGIVSKIWMITKSI